MSSVAEPQRQAAALHRVTIVRPVVSLAVPGRTHRSVTHPVTDRAAGRNVPPRLSPIPRRPQVRRMSRAPRAERPVLAPSVLRLLRRPPGRGLRQRQQVVAPPRPGRPERREFARVPGDGRGLRSLVKHTTAGQVHGMTGGRGRRRIVVRARGGSGAASPDAGGRGRGGAGPMTGRG